MNTQPASSAADHSPTFAVCVIGSANLDIVTRTERLPGPGETVIGSGLSEHTGGKGLNQAVASARSGARTAFVGAVGTDIAGEKLRHVLQADGIDDAATVTVAGRSGHAIVSVDANAENSIIVIPGANDHVIADQVPSSSVLLAQLEIPLDVVTAACQQAATAGTTVVLNPAPAVAIPESLLSQVTYLIPNEHELDLAGGAARALAAGCQAVIVTKGAAGVDIVTRDGTRSVAAFAVTPVDTTGAGDAFCGAFAARLAAGNHLDDAVLWAAAAGALATTVQGAVAGQPELTAIKKLLDGPR